MGRGMLHGFMHPANFKIAWYFEENYIQGLEIEKMMPGSMKMKVSYCGGLELH